MMRAILIGLALLVMSMFASACTPAAQQGGADGVGSQPPVTALKMFKGHGDLHLKAVIDGTLLEVDFKSNGLVGDGYAGELVAKIEAGQHMIVVSCKVSTGASTDVSCSAGYDFSSTRDPAMDLEGTQLLELSGQGDVVLELVAQNWPIKLAFDLDAATGEEVQFTPTPHGRWGKGISGEVLVSVQSFGAKCSADTRPDPDKFSCAPIISFGLPTAAVPPASPK